MLKYNIVLLLGLFFIMGVSNTSIALTESERAQVEAAYADLNNLAVKLKLRDLKGLLVVTNVGLSIESQDRVNIELINNEELENYINKIVELKFTHIQFRKLGLKDTTLIAKKNAGPFYGEMRFRVHIVGPNNYPKALWCSFEILSYERDILLDTVIWSKNMLWLSNAENVMKDIETSVTTLIDEAAKEIQKASKLSK